MTKEEMLMLMRLLSALEATGMMRDKELPVYLLEQVGEAVELLQREILK